MRHSSEKSWIHHFGFSLITARKRSLRRLCFYTCLSVHRGSTCTDTPQVHPLDRYITQAGTPPCQVHPLAGTPLAGTPPAGTPLPGRYNLPKVHPPKVHPQVHTSGRYTPLVGTPPVRYTPWVGTPPWAVHAGRYGQQACGTHPTGMHSCYTFICPSRTTFCNQPFSCIKWTALLPV